LFDAFPPLPTPQEAFRFQELLAAEILSTEGEQSRTRSQSLKEHLRAVRLYGDALSSTLLSKYSIRQLARNSGKAPHLTGQGNAFQLAVDCARVIASNGIAALLSDLTNVLRNGDLVVCVDPDSPISIECKLGKVKDPRFERQGRRGRQLARLESIHEFLRTGRGVIFGEEKERITVKVAHTPQFGYALVDKLVVSALDHKPLALNPSSAEFYAASILGEVADVQPALEAWKTSKGDHFALGSSLDPLRSGTWPDVPPPILWGISPAARWALMEGDVAISHAMRVEALVGLASGNIRVTSVIDQPGRIPWGYQIQVGDKYLSLSANLVLQVLYCHETVASVGEELLEQAEKAFALFGGAV